MKELLLIGDMNSLFVQEYIFEILLPIEDCRITVLTEHPKREQVRERMDALAKRGCVFQYYYSEALRGSRGRFSRVCRGICRFIKHGTARRYDVVQMIGVSVFAFMTAMRLRRDARLVASFIGFDVLESTRMSRRLMRPLLRRADAITMETEHEKKCFSELFDRRYDDKVILAVYGTDAGKLTQEFARTHTHEECKKSFEFPMDKLCVFVGTNGDPAHRHIEILHVLETLPADVRAKLFLVFHCAYGLEDSYENGLRAALDASAIECRLMTDYLTGDRLYALRMCMDVMINVQPTDAFSGTMMECMETETVVVKGGWMRYPELERHGAYLVDVSSVEDLARAISDIAGHFPPYHERARRNRGLSRLKSWEYSRDSWLKALGME